MIIYLFGVPTIFTLIQSKKIHALLVKTKCTTLSGKHNKQGLIYDSKVKISVKDYLI